MHWQLSTKGPGPRGATENSREMAQTRPRGDPGAPENQRLVLGRKLFCEHCSTVAMLCVCVWGGVPARWSVQRGEPTKVKGVSENIHTSGKP